ncbi:hypothetical protein BSF41_17530 [Flavobacterium sp. ACN2]|jgi:hypothetical protein|uniref:hypothetical protein n=1 Tax=Flavobacterium sp. ACN2 TaxID=1975676 RepID=UPI000BB2D720|nr:hypothetical protein [Flavobacterium sp. ACN2]PBI90082.1 hypothetical protein BSF41_17530 [Flavobacterium sp. ACN2]
MRNRLVIICLFFILFSCGPSKKSKENKIAYAKYLASRNIDPIKVNDLDYYDDFFEYKKEKKKQALINNPYLRVNQVYVHYINSKSVEFSVYSDKETFCLSTFDLDIDGQILSFPENGIVKVIRPIRVEDFGDFELTGNILKTRKRSKTPFNEWYDYVNGSIKNDTIHFTEKYVGTNLYKFKKKGVAKARKTDLKEIYQPNLKAEKHVNEYGLIYFTVTGEFKFVKQKDTDEEKMFMLMDKIKY